MTNTPSDRTSSGATSFRPEIARRTPDLPMAPRSGAPGIPLGSSPPGSVLTANLPGHTTAAEPEELKKLTVGKGIVLNGQITACDRLIVEGKVEATLSASRGVEIAESGTFKGSAEIDEAVVSGRFEGTLTIRGRLSIRSTGRVEGQIRYGQLEIEAGGQLVGDIGVYDSKAPAAQGEPATLRGAADVG